jgi:hypothetical protein
MIGLGMDKSSARTRIILSALLALACCGCASSPGGMRGEDSDELTFVVGKLTSQYRGAGEGEEPPGDEKVHPLSNYELTFKNTRSGRLHILTSQSEGLFRSAGMDEGAYEIVRVKSRSGPEARIELGNACVALVVREKVNNIGELRWMRGEKEKIEFAENYGEVKAGFPELDIPSKEWVNAKIYTEETSPLAGGNSDGQNSGEDEELTVGSDFFIFLTFTNYTWPFTGATMGFGYAYNYEIVSGFLSPGLSLSADVHPNTFLRVLKIAGLSLLDIILRKDIDDDDDEDEETQDDDDDDEDEITGVDYPWRGNFSVKIFNEFRFGKISLRPFFGKMFFSYAYHAVSRGSSAWITGAEIISVSTGWGLEFSYILPEDFAFNSNKSWFRTSVTFHL